MQICYYSLSEEKNRARVSERVREREIRDKEFEQNVKKTEKNGEKKNLISLFDDED